MIKLFIFAFVLLCLSDAANPGVKVAINKPGLDFAARKAVDLLAKQLPNVNFPSVSGSAVLKYEVKNIRLTSFTKPSASIDINPGSGLTIKLRDGAVRVDGRWGIKFFFFWRRGNIYASSNDIDLELKVAITERNGRPRLRAGSCNAHFGGFKIRTSGSLLSWLLNIIIRLFNSTIRKMVQNEVCKALVKVVNNDANQELATLNLIARITNDVRLDYRLTENPQFTSSYMASSHKGQFLFDPQSAFTPPPLGFTMGRMVSTTISEDTFNSLGRVMHARGLIDYRFTVTDKLFEKLVQGSDVQNFKLNMHIFSAAAPSVSISPSRMAVQATLDAEFRVPKMVLKLRVGVKASCTVRVEGDRVKGRLRGVILDIKVLENNLGFPIDPKEINELANGLIPIFLPTINGKLDQGVPLPKVQHVTFSRYLLNLSYRQIRVAANVS